MTEEIKKAPTALENLRALFDSMKLARFKRGDFTAGASAERAPKGKSRIAKKIDHAIAKRLKVGLGKADRIEANHG